MLIMTHPHPVPRTHQYTKTFSQWDKTENKATIKARKVKHGWIGSIRIGRIQKDVTDVHPFMECALSSTERCLLMLREHSVL